MKRFLGLSVVLGFCMSVAVAQAQLETLFTSDPGARGNATLVWTVFADGTDSAVANGNSVATTGSLSNASGTFSMYWTSEYAFDETTFAGTLSDGGGNKWGYSAGSDNMGPITPADTSLSLASGEAIGMRFDLSNLNLAAGFALRLDSMLIRNSNNSGEDSGGRFSFFDQNRGTVSQLTGQGPGQIAPAAGDPVAQALNQIVSDGDEVAFWRESGAGGQVRVGGFRFSIVPEPPAPTANDDALALQPAAKVRFPVLANDADLDAFDRIEILSPPSSGSASVDGEVIFYVNTDGTAQGDAFTYRVIDLDGRASAAATVSISLTSAVRIENKTLNVPLEAPSDTFAVENAFPGMSFFLPLGMASPPGETDRLFVMEKFGRIQLVSGVGGTPSKEVFFDLATLVSSRPNEAFFADGEGGLLGLAFHPNYASNGYFYVFYSVEISGQLHQRVSRFSVSGNPDLADSSSERILIEQRDDQSNHNGGDLHFGPDGYLYVAVGDEGGGNDSWDNSQRINKDYFSGILRIDVDKKQGNLEPNQHVSVKTDTNGDAFYSVPADNPWVGATSFNGSPVSASDVITEFYAVGLRNPWRFHFDPLTDELYVADVGQVALEEINIVEKGGNYGWAFFEASIAGPNGSAPDGFVQDAPIYEYGRGTGAFEGRSVSGGVVYRGTRYAELVGKYIFGDYTSGNIWALERDGEETVVVERLAGTSGPVGFGYDPSNGDVLVASINGGRIERIVTGQPSNAFPSTLSATGVFADLTDLSPNPGVLHYEPNLAFWSDHAIKDRWFTIPNPSDTMTYAAETPWTFPTGMVWVKHFEMETERGNPATRKRLETRLLVKNDEGSYGVSYRWNEEETEAFLVSSGGEDFVLAIEVEGEATQQTWRIPSRGECMICHLPTAGHALSFNTRQLNLDYAIGGASGNQIATLRDAGYLADAPSDVADLPRHLRPDETDFSLEARARSYLAVNCASCHNSEGANTATFDASAWASLEASGLVNGSLSNNGGDSSNVVVAPGDSAHSVLWHRMGATGGFTRMPPLASNELDQVGLDLIREWIDDELPQTYQTYAQWRLSNFGSDVSSEGEADEDADKDGRSNRFEWLTRTDPQDPTDFWESSLGPDQSRGWMLDFEWVLNRIIVIERSSNLIDWTPVEDPANHGFPAGLSSEARLQLAEPEARVFYRIRIKE